MNLTLRSAACGLLWSALFAVAALAPQSAQAGGGWRQADGWDASAYARGPHGDWRDDEGWYRGDRGHGDAGYGYGYGYGDDHRYRDDGYGYGHDGWDGYRGEGRWHDRDRGYDDRGWQGGRVWCPQRRAYVLPWEARGWRGDRDRRWRQHERYRHRRHW